MSVSNNPPLMWGRTVLTGAVIAALSLTAAWAQSEPPRTGPVTLMPPTAPQPPAPAAAQLTPAISVDALERIETDRIGLMDESAGAMPGDMWTGSDPAFVRAILPQLPHKMPSLAMRRLAQHLLLPQARQPQPKAAPFLLDAGAPVDPGLAPDAGQTEPSTWLLEARATALAGMGDWPNVIALIEMVPQDRLTESLIRLRVDGLLVEGNTDAACTEAQAAMSRQPEAHWQKVQIYCQFLSKQNSAAQLGLSLLREEGVADPLFFWAADVLQGSRPLTPPNLVHIPPLELAMLRTAGQPFPDAVVSSGDPTMLRVLASMPVVVTATFPDDKKVSAEEKKKQARQSQDSRLLVAEQAVALGVLDPSVLRDLYLKLDLSQEPTPPVPLAEATAESVRTRAYIYQLAKSQTVPVARAEVIARVLDLARAEKGAKGLDMVTVSQVYAAYLSEFTPSPDLIWFAGHAARGLLAAGQPDKAQSWFDLAKQMARGSIEATAVADSLWAIEHIKTPGSQSRLTPQNLRAWQAALPDGKAAPLREGLLSLLTALGDPITVDDWLPVVGAALGQSAAVPTAPNIWHGLSLAARDARVGDTATLSLVALGDGGPHRASAVTLAKIVESLTQVGREADARMIAVEAALIQGL